MHNYINHPPQQCTNNFRQSDHVQRHSEHYVPENPLLTNPIGSGDFFTAIEQALPPIFTRKKAAEVLGGLISAKTLSNLDALKTGPSRVWLGSKVGYKREEFILWLRSRIKTYR